MLPAPLFIFAVLALVLALFIGLASASAANASTWTPLQRESAALNWAETQTGCWYAWSGTNCGQGYDCSGLVYEAFLHEGVNIGRDTYGMLHNWHVRWIPASWARRGDLAFYGSGHVEILTMWYHTTFGSQQPGTRVGWHRWGGWWQPTAFYRVY